MARTSCTPSEHTNQRPLHENWRPCTGWLDGDDILAAAGHCVHPGKGQDGGGGNGFNDRESFEIAAARNGTDDPYGACVATQLLSVGDWIEGGAEEGDHWAIRLDCEVGDTTDCWGLRWRESDMDGLDATVTGILGDKEFGTTLRYSGISSAETEKDQLFY